MEDDMKKMWEELQTPLHPSYISIKTETRKGRDIDMPFIDYTDLILLLNDICGLNWSFTPVIVKDDGSYCEMMGHLTIAGVTRSNIGDGEGDNYGGARKKAIANTLVRCAMLFGLGLELWKDPAGAMRRRREWERQQGSAPVEQPSAPAKKQAAAPAPQTPRNVQICKLSQKGRATLLEQAPEKVGLNPAHFKNRLLQRYGDKWFESTEYMDEFLFKMALEHEAWEAYIAETPEATGGAEIDQYLDRSIA